MFYRSTQTYKTSREKMIYQENQPCLSFESFDFSTWRSFGVSYSPSPQLDLLHPYTAFHSQPIPSIDIYSLPTPNIDRYIVYQLLV